MDAIPPVIIQIWKANRSIAVEQITEAASSSQLSDISVEPAFRNNDGSLFVQGELNLPMRSDLVARIGNSQPQAFTFSSEQYVDFEPVEFEYKGVFVRQFPFVWTQAQIEVHGSVDQSLSPKLRNWFLEHFGDADAESSTDLQYALHFLSEPKYSDQFATFELDLGTAQPESLTDLLEILVSNGAVEIGISTELAE